MQREKCTLSIMYAGFLSVLAEGSNPALSPLKKEARYICGYTVVHIVPLHAFAWLLSRMAPRMNMLLNKNVWVVECVGEVVRYKTLGLMGHPYKTRRYVLSYRISLKEFPRAW